MTHDPFDSRPRPRCRAPVGQVLVVALLAQLVAPAFARASAAPPDGSAPGVAVPAASAPPPAAGTPAFAAATPGREDRHWAELVRACASNAKHVRLHVPGGVLETDEVTPQAEGLRFRAPHLASRTGAISEAYADADTLVAWNDVSKVEVRNVNSSGEAAATGLVVGLGVGSIVALVAATAAAVGSVLTFQEQDSHAAGYVLGAAAIGLAIGAAAGRHRNGGWVTCCERDTSEAVSSAVTPH